MKKNIFIKFALLLCIQFSISQTTTSLRDGDWSSDSTWSNGVPNSSKRAIIAKETTVNIDGTSSALETVVHGVLNVNENGNYDKSLTTRWVHVNSGGLFQIGSASNRFDQGNFALNLTGVNPDSDHIIPLANGNTLNLSDNDGFLMVVGNGRLQFFAKDKISFTKLSRTANKEDSTITVENIIDRDHDGILSATNDGTLNWEVGDEIVIASTGHLYTDEEVRIITAIQNQGTTTKLTLDSALNNKHYGEIETYGTNLDPMSNPILGGPRSIDMRAEVALLSRNVKIQGLESQDTDISFGDKAKLQVGGNGKAINGVGGHIMIMSTAGQITVDGVQLHRLGQAGRLGRYPFHWHFARDRTGDVLRNSSITNSNNRAVVVHTTDNVLVEGVVAHDFHGHGFFTEDGVERHNKFMYNIAFGSHRVHPDDDRKGAAAFVVDDTDRFFDRPARSRTTAAFWMANAGNDYIGNIVAGAEGTGYWYGQPAKPRGASETFPEYANYKPREIPLDEFNHNSVHSSETGFVTALGIGNGAPNDLPQGDFRQNERLFGDINPVFKNLTIYGVDVGLYPLVSNITHIFDGLKAADNDFINYDSDPTLIRNALMIGKSRGNPSSFLGTIGSRGYHGNSIIENAHIAGFAEGKGRFFAPLKDGNRIRSGAEVEKLTYENDNSLPNMNWTNQEPFGNNRDIYDRDGSLTSYFGGGPGYSFIKGNDFTIDPAQGDIPNNNPSTYQVSKQRFANLQFEDSGLKEVLQPPKMLITAPNGHRRDLIDFSLDSDFLQRAQLSIGNEYLIELPEGYDYSNEKLRFTLHQWSLPHKSVGVLLRFKNQANQIIPRDFDKAIEIPTVNSIEQLRDSKDDAYFLDTNGDLVLKIMNRGLGIHEGYIDIIDNNAVNSPRNHIARNKPTSQSTTGFGGISSRAVDGNTDGIYNNESVSTTADNQPGWWKVDLLSSYNITDIIVHNRTDCCQNRLDGVSVYIGSIDSNNPADYTKVGDLGSNQTNPINNINKTGQYVLLHRTDANALTLAEVEVHGTIANSAPLINFEEPLNNTIYEQGQNVYVKVNANDIDGNVSNVQLFLDDVLIRAENLAPYEWGGPGQNDPELLNLDPGTYELRAVVTDNEGATTEESILIIVEETLGTTNPENLIKDIMLSPNPVNESFFVFTKTVQIKSISIYDVKGRLLSHSTYDGNKLGLNRDNPISINVNHFNSGLYLIKVKTASDNTITKKILKK